MSIFGLLSDLLFGASQIQVFNHNVLATPLANKEWYFTTPQEHLDSVKREAKFGVAIGDQVANFRVICLQEVPLSWKEQLEVTLPKFGYRVYSAVQGDNYNDYMSVVLAIPPQLKVKSVKYIPFKGIVEKDNFTDDRYNKIRRVWNWIVLAELHDGLTLATTHFPCRYKDPEAMNAYAKGIVTVLSPYRSVILAGDFNSEPSSDVYKTFRANWYFSAYGNEEPKYTTKCVTKSSPTGYQGCIDYIFYKGAIEVVECVMPDQDGTDLPNEKQYSDHLPLLATFKRYDVSDI